MMKRLAAILLASTCLVPVASTPARGEVISGLIGLTTLLTSAGLAAGTASAVGGAIVGIGISVGVNVLSSVLKKTEASEGTSPEKSGTTLNVQYGAALPRSARMGPGATGGHHVYTNVAGGNNDILQCVFVIGDGQHGRLTRLRYNDKECTLPADTLSTNYPVPEFVKDGQPHVVIRYFRGRYDQTADPELIAYANPAGRWTTNHRGRGVCYLSIDQVYDEEQQLTGIPQLMIETEGLVLYDPRKDSTNGGSGPHRWGQPDTYEPSANPAVQEYNVRRGVYVNNQRILGMTTSPVNLLLAMYVSAANVNDEAVPLREGGTEPRYRCSVELSDARSNADVLGAIRASTAGFTLERGGQFGPIPGVPQIPDSSMAFTDDDLIVGERATFTKYRSRSDMVTAVYGKFSDPGQQWAAASFPPREDAADDAAIGERLAKDIDLTQVYSSSQAQRIAECERRRTLQQGQGTATLPAKWIGVQPGDWLTYNSARHGNMTVLVTSAALDANRHVMTIGYERIANSVYSWTTAGELFPPDIGTGGAITPPITSAAGMSAVGVNLPGDGGLMTPGIAFSWTPILDPSVDQIDFEIRKVGDTNVLPFTAEFPSSGSAVCSGHGIAAATAYEYRHKLYTTPLRDTPWSAWLTVTSGTQHIVPQALFSIPGDVELASFEAGLRDYVANQLGDAQAQIDRWQQLVANEAAEQDANNFIHRQKEKEADQRIVEQVSAQYGTTWRGLWKATTPYQADDQVEYGGELYYTPVAVKGTPPTSPPWVRLMSTARISEKWISFAGEDGAAAQTSDSIETRFGASTLTKSVATVHSEWSAFAGPDGASATSVEEITAAIGDNAVDISTNATAIATIDGKLVGSYSITVDANGYVSGLAFYNDGHTSNFTILTDSFLIAKPGSSGGLPVPVFALGTSGTTPKLVLRGDMIADGTITSAALVAGSVTAVKMAAAAIAASNIIADNVVITGHLVADAATTLQSAGFSKGLTPGDRIKDDVLWINAVTGHVTVSVSMELNGVYSESIPVWLRLNSTRIKRWVSPVPLVYDSVKGYFVQGSAGNTQTYSFSLNVAGGGNWFGIEIGDSSAIIPTTGSPSAVGTMIIMESRR